MKGFWKWLSRVASMLIVPAVAIMNRLTYPRKFLLISILFILPLALVMYLLTSEIRKGIDFADQELLGARYLRPCRALSEHVAESRVLAHSVAGGAIARRPELVRKQIEIDEDLRALAAIESEANGILKTASKFAVVQENQRFLKAKLFDLTTADSEALHTQLLADIQALQSHAGDTSNLILDPDLDSYYAMDAVLLKLPQGQSLLHQLALLGEKTLGRKTPLSTEDKAEFIRLESLLRSNLDETRSGLSVAFRNNPNGRLQPQLDKLLQDYLAAGEQCLDSLIRDILKPADPQVAAASFARLCRSCMAANTNLSDITADELNTLLRERIGGFSRKRNLVIAFAIVILALVIYLLVAFYVGVMRTVVRLQEASERMLGGSIDHTVTLETRDELGQVATSFNNIADRLRMEWTQAREESARALAAEASLREQEKELRKAKEDAEEATRTKSVFLATMSHEIRTPLNAVLGMASLLQDTELNSQQEEFARVIQSSGEALLGVINDILDFSKIEAGQLDLEREPLELRACIEGAMDVIAARGAEKGLELAYHCAPEMPPWILGDVTRLRQILINLLGNAVKFTEKGEVVVNVMSTPTADGRHELTFQVRDTGVGIPADRISRLFRSFSQVDASTTRKYGGTGLGLAISKRLTEMMGGRMEVTSVQGQGSTFQFSIIASAATAATPTHSLTEFPDPGSKRLLIVDDNDTNRRIVSLVLQGWGFKTHDTASPLEALRWLDAGEEYDLGILDIAMPEMDGLTLAATIRQKPATAKIPLVAFTSLTRREALGDRREFDAFVTKPLKPSLLRDVLLTLFTGQVVERADRSRKQIFDDTLGQRLPLRLLVAEDVAVNQQMMRVMLTRLGYPVDFADNGREVLRAMDRQTYDLIFMDMQMPEMDGLECTRAILARQMAEQQPIIVALTANASAEDEAACRAAGMADFLSKPIKPLELRNCLERWGKEFASKRVGSGQGTVGSEESSSFPTTAHCPLPTTDSHSQLPTTPPTALLDEAILEDLRDLDAGEPGLLQSFIDGFRQAVPEHLALMRQALANIDGEELRKVAHRLKGTAANVGASGVAEQCAALEKLGRSGALAGGALLIHELEQRFLRTSALFVEVGVCRS